MAAQWQWGLFVRFFAPLNVRKSGKLAIIAFRLARAVLGLLSVDLSWRK